MLVTFVVTTWLLAMLPGVGQALMLRQTLLHGPGVAVATIGGTATGLVLWATAAAAGVSAVVLANPLAYRVLLALGGAFLAYVGLRTLWSATRSTPALPTTDRAGGADRRHAYLAGLATNLGNPKAGVFALSLLPRFVGADPSFASTVALGLIWSAVTAAWYLLFVMLVARGRSLVTRPWMQRGIGALSGAVLVVLGVSIAVGI
ncbi:LysE family translocator [Acrocarpospora macrocephala]|uniref:Lysine exporter protein LysE/YggA n=1 Tax=Acrocarpospora macrocephala TaxID=150177 RepID=A0A5M3WF80_9ACTN|nr:LysE family translocator [Acrocarpospora macrocephala]GES06732.1 lysine exporter protein LysE/YggA [Acrocarpospora macrocephala]